MSTSSKTGSENRNFILSGRTESITSKHQGQSNSNSRDEFIYAGRSDSLKEVNPPKVHTTVQKAANPYLTYDIELPNLLITDSVYEFGTPADSNASTQNNSDAPHFVNASGNRR